jgi:rsbT co-antagonist protein RsbR
MNWYIPGLGFPVIRDCPSIAGGGIGMAKEPSASIEITEQELLRRKDFLEFSEDDVGTLSGINDVAQRYAESVIDDFYKHLLSFEETRAFFRDHQVLVLVNI